VRAYSTSTVNYGNTCEEEEEDRACNDGTLDGSYKYSSCRPGAPAYCIFNGQTIAHGQNVIAFSVANVVYPQKCVLETRTCDNSVLSGNQDAIGSCVACR
jgi:hypothetical protein